jgi:CRP-like cAMP-binding protein
MATSPLTQIPFFSNLPTEELDRLQSELEVLNLRSGEMLFREGEAGENLYIVVSGELEIFMGSGTENDLILNVVREGEYIGEMSLLQSDAHRTTSARTRGDTVLLSMSRLQFREILQGYPGLARSMISVLSQRLANANNVQMIRELTKRLRQLKELQEQYDELKASIETPADIFISYARSDAIIVQSIFEALLGKSHRPWMDIHSIKGGENWLRAIYRAINECQIFLAVLSNNSISRRGAIQKELKKALDKWEGMLPDDIYIIPIRIDDCPIPDLLKHIQVLNWEGGNGENKLLEAIRVGLARRKADN